VQVPAVGALADSLIQYPVTPIASVAVKEEIETVKEVAVAGIVKAVTVGAVVSASSPDTIPIISVPKTYAPAGMLSTTSYGSIEGGT
jgi:hypothetical protein